MTDIRRAAATPPVHDPAALWAARFEIRKTVEAIKRLRQVDPSIRVLLDQLDELCCDLTIELEAMEPPLPFHKVVPSVPASQSEGV